MLSSRAHLFQRFGIAIARCRKAQFSRRKITYRIAVHGELGGLRRRHDIEAVRFQFSQNFCPDRFNFGNDVVRAMRLYCGAQLLSIEHGKDLARISDLHGRRVVIRIASDDKSAEPLGRDHKFTAQFARTEEENLRRVAHTPSAASSP